MRNKKIPFLFALAAFAFSIGASATAANSNAVLTADNAFSLYTGNATGSDLQLVGSGSDWTTAFFFQFNANPGDYLYVMAQDFGEPHAWQGAFNTPSGTIFSGAAGWLAAGLNSPTVNAAVVSTAAFGPISPTADLPFNAGPWGSRVGNANADWIWSASVNSGDRIVLFRTAAPVNAVPLSGTLATMVSGVGLLGLFGRRRHVRPA